MKRLAVLLVICLLLVVAWGAQAEGITVSDIQKYGNLVLSVKGSELLESGYAYGDIVTVSIAGMECEMPVGSNYSDVDEGSAVCRVVTDESTDAVVLAINMGDLATKTGIAVKTATAEEPGYRWDYRVTQPVEVTFAMKEQAGYLDQYLLRQLQRTNRREDYSHLTDAQFANFRPVETSGMGQNVLYRSSSPINTELGRNAFADAALREAGIRTVINLADSIETMETHEGWANSCYAACDIIALNLGVDFAAADFQHGLADGLRFLAVQEGPYLVHCTEGKDRAGFVSALLECLMGASADEVAADYMTTYFNYYGVVEGSEQYRLIAQSNIQKSLQTAFGVENLYAADLAAEAREYLLEQLGLTDAEIDLLQGKLAGR